MKKTPVGPGNVLTAVLSCFFLLFVFIGCRKNPTPPPGTDPAHGYFTVNESGQCSSGVPHGIFYNGLPVNTDSNYIDVSVYVTHAGAYTIYTDTVDGVKFSASGNFGDTGVQVARLKGAGSFKTVGNFSVPVHFDSSGCRFDIIVEDSAGLDMLPNEWKFTAEGKEYRGPFSLQIFDVPQLPLWNFDLEGRYGSTGDTVFTMAFTYSSVTNLDTGSYSTADRDIDLVSLYITNPGVGGVVKSLYTNNTSLGAVIIMHVLSRVQAVSPTVHPVVVASFSGSVVNSAGAVVPLTNGKFKWGAP